MDGETLSAMSMYLLPLPVAMEEAHCPGWRSSQAIFTLVAPREALGVGGEKPPLPSSTRSPLLVREERLQIMSWNKADMEKLLFSPDGSSHRSLTQRQLPCGSLESVSPNGNPKLNPTRHLQSSRLVVQCHSSGPLY